MDKTDCSTEKSPMGDLASAFEFALHQREFEINQLTQRNNFFMIFQGVLISGLVQSQGTAAAVVSFAVCLLGFLISLLQVGMAAGSKYWQVRWERAAKTTEIWLLKSLKNREQVSNFFTADGRHLTGEEKKRLVEINKENERQEDPLTFEDDAITKANQEEFNMGAVSWKRSFENGLIQKKYSVSRIPIWVGILLAGFWFFLLTFTISIKGWHPCDCFAFFTLTQFKS